MEVGGCPDSTLPNRSGAAVLGDGVFPTPSDAAELMDPPNMEGQFGPVEGEEGMTVEGQFEPVEGEEGMAGEGTEGSHETVDLTGSSGVDENCGSAPSGYKKRFRGRNGSAVRVGSPVRQACVEGP